MLCPNHVACLVENLAHFFVCVSAITAAVDLQQLKYGSTPQKTFIKNYIITYNTVETNQYYSEILPTIVNTRAKMSVTYSVDMMLNPVHIIMGEVQNVLSAMRLNRRWSSSAHVC